MKQEDRILLLTDLSARLTYGVKCVSGVDDATLIIEGINPKCNGASEVQVTFERNGINFGTQISTIKPYLFPLSSMNLDQRIEYSRTLVIFDESHCSQTPETYDWLNKNHFDYRGLIEKGLAIDATNKNIY
jgi:hypothetical protein